MMQSSKLALASLTTHVARTTRAQAENRVAQSNRIPSFLVYRLRQICLGIMTEVIAPAGLMPVEYAALTTLDAEPGLDQRHLAARLAIDKMSASQLIGRLERRGLLNRSIDPQDRRARVLSLTAEGRALRRQLQPAAHAAQERIMAPLDPEERPLLIDLLTRMVEGHHRYARPGNGRRGPRRGEAQPTVSALAP